MKGEYLLKEQPLSKEILEKEFEHKINPITITTAKKKRLLSVFDEFIEVSKQICVRKHHKNI